MATGMGRQQNRLISFARYFYACVLLYVCFVYFCVCADIVDVRITLSFVVDVSAWIRFCCCVVDCCDMVHCHRELYCSVAACSSSNVVPAAIVARGPVTFATPGLCGDRTFWRCLGSHSFNCV